MKTTVLFDLDGTLLPMDFDKFMKLYFYNMGVHFHGKIEPELLTKSILEATEVMVKTNDGRTNMDIFMEHFGTLIDGDMVDIKRHFDDFYETLFANVQASTFQSEAMLKSVRLLKDKGYDLIIATNPLFPLRANIHRMNWAGLDLEMFDYMSSFEENRYCKPHIEFYQEVLAKIGKKAEECIMVGNDVFDDLPAGKIGMETYLITDCMLNKYQLENTADHTGTYEDFYQFVQSLEDRT